MCRRRAVIDSLRLYMSRILALRAIPLHRALRHPRAWACCSPATPAFGKSELGLELISRGHGLVADDAAVDFVRLGPDLAIRN